MNLDWRVILTQIVGFLIVLWILKRYAWGKMLAFMELRRETIAREFEDIDRQKADAEALRLKYEQELADIEATRRSKIQEAAHEAQALASDIKEDARKDAVALRTKTQHDIKLEMEKANAELRDQMVNQVITATEKLIHERLDDTKHKELINSFLGDVDKRSAG